jgi:opacity protein-like surface antigen
MKKSLIAIALVLVSGACAFAQDVPKVDLFLGYSMFRANSDQGIDAFTMNGGIGTLGLNFNNHFAAEFEFGGYSTGHINGRDLDTTNLTYLFGPRFSVNRKAKVDPYVHFLFGGDRLTTSGTPSAVICTPTSANCGTTLGASQNNFGMAIGGGLNIKMTKRFEIRPVQLDYMLTRFETINLANPSAPTQNHNQNNLRYSAGLVINFGSR